MTSPVTSALSRRSRPGRTFQSFAGFPLTHSTKCCNHRAFAQPGDPKFAAVVAILSGRRYTPVQDRNYAGHRCSALKLVAVIPATLCVVYRVRAVSQSQASVLSQTDIPRPSTHCRRSRAPCTRKAIGKQDAMQAAAVPATRLRRSLVPVAYVRFDSGLCGAVNRDGASPSAPQFRLRRRFPRRPRRRSFARALWLCRSARPYRRRAAIRASRAAIGSASRKSISTGNRR